ncbi:Nn.00g058970.m01.CDS01 [Neocucurbitaria sp. VM-36]
MSATTSNQNHGPSVRGKDTQAETSNGEQAEGPFSNSDEPLKRTWYRTTFFNCTIVAICAFIAPGLWAAINGLGAGGAEDPRYVNAANSVIFVLQFVVCIFGSSIVSWLGIRWAFVSGMIGFPIYAASLYTHVKYGNNWFLMVACVIEGVFSGIFWLTEAAIMLTYPEKHKRGRYLAYWLACRIVGQMIGGTISLAVNVDSDQRGHISVDTYLPFIAIQAIGPFVATLLSSPEKVQRSDQTRVKVETELPKKLTVELQSMWKFIRRKEILLLTPMIFQSAFPEAFISTYNATYFTVRSRALASLVASFCVIITNFLLGFFLDWRKFTVNARATVAFCLVYGFVASLYVYAMVVTREYEARDERPTFDWLSDGFGRAVCVYIFLLIGLNLMVDYLYWLIGTVNKNNGDLVRLSALVRGLESAGQAISYGLNSIDQTEFQLSNAVSVNMSLFLFCIIPSAMVIWKSGVVNGVKVHAIVQDEETEYAVLC